MLAESPKVPVRALLWVIGWGLVFLAAAAVLGTSYRLTIGATAGLSALLALSVVVVTGLAGQFSLASAAFYGVGAYGSAILTANYGWPSLSAAAASACAAGLLAMLIGRPILRLKGHFLAMATLAVNEIFVLLLIAAPSFTGGNDGKGGIPPLGLAGMELTSLEHQFLLAWCVVGLALYFTLRLASSRVGRAWAFIHPISGS